MRKSQFIIIALLLSIGGVNAQGSFKRHNYGLEANFGHIPYHNSYIVNFLADGSFINVENQNVWDISLKYEYRFNKRFSLSLSAGYMQQVMGMRGYIPYFVDTTIGDRCFTLRVQHLNIPLVANYRLPITSDANILLGAGFNASLALKQEYELSEQPSTLTLVSKPFDLDFVAKAGLEVESKRRVQFNATLYQPMIGNINYRCLGFDVLTTNSKEWVPRLMFGVSLFF